MAEYINKQILDDIRIPIGHYIRSDLNTAYQQGCKDMLTLVKSIPSAANVQAHVKGAWIIYNAPFTGTLCCSVCGFNVLPEESVDYNFCPNCGAYMRGEKDG